MTDEKKKPEEDEVTDEELEDVAGGADIDYQSGLRVQLEQSRQKTSTGTSFSDVAASGLSKGSDLTESAPEEST